MKIVVSGYIGKKITGIGRNLISLLDNSTSENKYVIYTNYDMKDDFVFSNPNVTIKTYNVSKNSSMKNLLWTTFVYPLKVLREKADLSLIPNFTLLLFKFKPTIIIMHDLIEFNVPDKFSKKKMFYRTKIADPITAKRADHIITVSENSKKDIIKFLGISDSKISVVYNGVDQRKFQRMDIAKATRIIEDKGWPSNFILYAGTIDHPGKNAMGVIKAFEKLRQEGRYTGALILAGMPGAGYDVVHSYAMNSTESNAIVFTGFVSDEELVALYSQCEVFCFVSLYEGFGIPPLEALSCGAKVIVSNISSLPEVVGTIGATVDPNDNDVIANTILGELASDRYDEIELKHWLLKFDWQNLSKSFEKVLCSEE